MTASDEARETALLAAQAAADKLATDVSIVDVSDRLAITDAFVLASAPNERQVQAIVDEVEERLRAARHQAGAPRGRRGGPLGAAGLRRRRGARAARRGARLLRPRAALEGLPDHPVRRPARIGGAGGRRAGAAGLVSSAGPPAPAGVPRLLVWRHGRTAWNEAGRFQGQQDPPLVAGGPPEAAAAARHLVADGLAADGVVVATSDLVRAVDTATALADLLGVPPARRPPAARARARHLGGPDPRRGRGPVPGAVRRLAGRPAGAAAAAGEDARRRRRAGAGGARRPAARARPRSW